MAELAMKHFSVVLPIGLLPWESLKRKNIASSMSGGLHERSRRLKKELINRKDILQSKEKLQKDKAVDKVV